MSKVLLVTGGSRGIGAAICALVGRRDYAVAVNYNAHKARADAVVADIARAGGKAIAVKADVADRAQVEAMFLTIDRELGTLDALVNNAGTNGKVVPFADIDDATFREVYETNLFGFVYCAQQAVRRMSNQRGGRGGVIVNVSSVAARTGGMPGHVHYASSKGAVDVFGYALAREVASHGIRVVTLRPGMVDTEIQAVFKGTGVLEKALANVPLGRMGRPEEIAEAALWLISPAASYVTATTLDVSGGR